MVTVIVPGASDLAKPLLAAGLTFSDKVLGIVKVIDAAETLLIGIFTMYNSYFRTFLYII